MRYYPAPNGNQRITRRLLAWDRGELPGRHALTVTRSFGHNAAMLRLLLALAATVVVGLVSRLHPVGWYLYDRALGEVLYAVAAYLVLAMLLFRKPPLLIAVLAWACCLAVEVFKLTGIPAEHQRLLLVRWFLGMTFSYLNLAYYFIGVLLIALADRATRTHQETKMARGPIHLL